MRNSCIEYLAIFIIVGSLHNFILCTAIRVGNIGFIAHIVKYEIKRLKRVSEGSTQSERVQELGQIGFGFQLVEME